MSSSNYFVKIKDPYNVPVLNINEFYSLELFRTEYGVGSLYIDLPLKEFITQNISTEWRIEVYRKTVGGELVRVGDTQWIVKLVRYKVDEQNETSLHLVAYDAMYLLEKRIVAYVDGTPQTTKTMPADDMIKAIVRENLGALATDYHRDLSDWLIVESDSSSAPIVTKSEYGMQMVLPILNDICQLSESAGIYLSYDIVYDESIGKLVFKTYTKQRGADRGSMSPSPIYLSHHTDPVNVMGGGLNYASIEIDATDERSYIYSGRQAQDTNAIFAEIGNTIALGTGPLARSEDFITTGESVEYNDVMREAHAQLQDKFRNLILNAHIEETDSMQFGQDYGFGDVVALRYLGTTLNIHLSEFRISVDGNGKEDISVTSLNTEKELLVPPLTGLDAPPVIKNEPGEDDEMVGAPLFYKNHTVAQSFMLPAVPTGSYMRDIDYVKVLMRRSGLPERNVSMRICDSNGVGGMPGTVVAASPIKSFDTFADGVYTWARFELNPSVQLARNKIYWLTLTCGIAKSNDKDYYLVGVDPETRYKDGMFRVSTDGSTFAKFTEYEASDKGWEATGKDIPFKTYKNSLLSQNPVSDASMALNNNTTSIVQLIWLPESEITNININVKRFGLPGNLNIKLCEWDSEKVEPGEDIASANVDALDISNDFFADYDFQFQTPAQLTHSGIYCIDITADALSDINYYLISVDTTQSYTPGAAYRWIEADWADANVDIPFKTYKNQVVSVNDAYNAAVNLNGDATEIVQTVYIPECEVTNLEIRIKRFGYPGDIQVALHEWDAVNLKPGTQLASSQIDSLDISASAFNFYDFILSTPEEITLGALYCIAISASGLDASNYYQLSVDTSQGYTPGVAYKWLEANFIDANVDIPFKTYKNVLGANDSVYNSAIKLDSNVTELVQTVSLSISEITNLEIRAKRYGIPGDLTVALHEWDAVNTEPGTRLASARVDALDISTSAFNFYDFIFSTPEKITVAGLYCIVVSSSGLNLSNYYQVAIDTTKSYTPGVAYKMVVVNEIETYVLLNSDLCFKIYNLTGDISFTTSTTTLDIGKTNDSILQTFTVSSTTRLFKAGVYIAKVGNPSKNVTVSIGRMVGNSVVEQIDSFTVDHRLITTSHVWYEEYLDGETLTSGNTYCIRISADGDDSNYYTARVDAGKSYSGGIGMKDTEERYVLLSSDLYFKIYKLAADISFTASNSTLDIGKSNDSILQTFTVSSSKRLFKAGAYIAKVGSPSDDITISIGRMAGNSIVEQIDSFTIHHELITTSHTWHEGYLNGETLTSGNTYCISMSANGDDSNYYTSKADTNKGYAGGIGMKDIEERYVLINSDLYFKVYRLIPDISFTTFGTATLDIGKLNNGILQTFKVGAGTRLFRLGVYVAKVGDPGDLHVSTYELKDGNPLTQVSGFTLDHRLVETSFAWYEDGLNGNVMSSGKTYGIWFDATGDENNYYIFRYDANNGYLNGEAFIDRIEIQHADADMLFMIGQKLK